MKIEDYNQAIKYLEGFIGKIVFNVKSSKDPLERMRIFLSLLGNPQEKFKSVLVGGTSGKGSTSYLISHILTTAGYKTGLTISPHLQKVNERLQINGKEVSDEEFVKLGNAVKPAIEKMSKLPTGEPSYFEILVGMVFKYFAEQKVDIAVVEVGMGGEFDATNTLYPLVAVITNVGLDHTNILGKTIEKIARTKAGIIKKNQELRIMNQDKKEINHDSCFMLHDSIVVTGVKQPSVIKIVEDRCREVGAKLFRFGKDFGLTNLDLSLQGDYQRENASLAIEVIHHLADFGFKISEENIKKALSTAFFPGRFEIIKVARQPRVSDDAHLQDSETQSLGSDSLSKSRLQTVPQSTFSSSESGLPRSGNMLPATPLIVLDGAHNPDKMKAFLNSLKKIFPPTSPRLRGMKKIFIIGFKFDKDIKEMLKQIVKVADEIIVTEFSGKTDVAIHAFADAESIMYNVLSIKYEGKVTVERDSEKALKKALAIKQFNNSTIIVVTGSLYLVGEIRSFIQGS